MKKRYMDDKTLEEKAKSYLDHEENQMKEMMQQRGGSRS